MDRPLDPGNPGAFRAPRELDVLVPSRNRPAELAAALAGLAAQEVARPPAGEPGPDARGGPDTWGGPDTRGGNGPDARRGPGTRGGDGPDARGGPDARPDARGRDAPDARPVEPGFGVAVSDQSDGRPAWRDPAVAGMVRILRHRGHPVLLDWNRPRRGVAENRAHLLSLSQARYVLFLDDDIWLEPGSVDRLLVAIRTLGCGLVGNCPHGLSYVDDYRPGQENGYEEWTTRPEPERIEPRGPEWSRASVHAAANLLHVQQRLRLREGEWRAYKVSWIGACVLFDRAALVECGGYDFWRRVPHRHQGEDVLAQLRVLARHGGAGILPSGAYHLETPTTVPDRDVECFDVVPPHGTPVR